MSSITANIITHGEFSKSAITHREFSKSAITFVDNHSETSPHTPPPEVVTTPTEHPANHPPLTIATKPKEGEIITRIHHHGYPLSPQSSLNVLQSHAELYSGTLCTIAIGLTNTAIGCTFQHLEARSEIEQFHKELMDLHVQMSCELDVKCPDSFEKSHGHLPNFTIPDANGIMRQACYVKLGNGPVPFALSTLGQDGDPIFQYNLFATPTYDHTSGKS